MFNSPFTNPYATRAITKSLLRTSKFSFPTFITGLEKTITTINQIIPIYTQVKPLVTSSRSLLNGASKLFKRTKPQPTTTKENDIINVEIKETKKEEKISSNINVNQPYKPFFIEV